MKIPIPDTILSRVDDVIFTIAALAIAIVISTFLRKIMSASFSSLQNKKLIPESMIGKTNTLNSVMFNVLDVFIYTITLLVILSHWKVDISPILTGASIFGIAVTFGSQTLVKDIISGFFIISESQYNVGDRVRIGTFEGRVTRVTLRLTVLKDDDGNRIFIPNSSITQVVRIKPITKSTIIKNPKASLKKKLPEDASVSPVSALN